MKQKIDYRILFLQNVYKQFQEFQPFLKNDNNTIHELGSLLAKISNQKGDVYSYIDQLINKLKASKANAITNQFLTEAQSFQTEYNVNSKATSGRAARMALGKMAHHQRQKINNRVIRKVVTNTSDRLLIKLEKTGNVPAFEVEYDFGGKPRIKAILPYQVQEETFLSPAHTGNASTVAEEITKYNTVGKPENQEEPSPQNPDRYLIGETKAEVKSGEKFDLKVKVSATTSEKKPGYNYAGLPSIEGALTIIVHCEGIECIGENSKKLQVPPTGDSEELIFHLAARESGKQLLFITALKGGAHVAGFPINVSVDISASDNSGQHVSASGNIDPRQPEDGEYTLEIVFENALNRYRFQLTNKDYGNSGSQFTDLTGERLAMYTGLLKSLNEQAQGIHKLSIKLQSARLRGLSKMMTSQLMPPKITETLWQEKDRIKRLNILCEGDSLPWELIYLDGRPGEPGFFLAEITNIARWRYGAPPPATIDLNPVYLVHPDGSPKHTWNEIQELQRQLSDAKIIKTAPELMEVLVEGKFSVLHFAAHNYNQTDKIASSYIPFGQSKFDLVLMYDVDKNVYANTRPLVFMNACTTAGETPLLREMTSWANEYLNRGAGAFIGSLWEVVDQTAPDFSISFYKSLKAGKTLGEAMMNAREAIKAKDEGDPTRFAYTLYGNPQAKLKLK